MRRKTVKRVLCAALSMCMCMGSLTGYVPAAETEEEETAVQLQMLHSERYSIEVEDPEAELETELTFTAMNTEFDGCDRTGGYHPGSGV